MKVQDWTTADLINAYKDTRSGELSCQLTSGVMALSGYALDQNV